jgi:hypothetical protein
VCVEIFLLPNVGQAPVFDGVDRSLCVSLLGSAPLVLILMGLTVGCASQGATPPTISLSGDLQQVEVLPGPPERPFKVIGHISLSEIPDTNWQTVSTHLREQAGAIGANAVFLGDPQMYPVGAVINPPDSTRHAREEAVVDTRFEASLRTLFRLVRAPRGKTTPSTNPRSISSTGVAISYQ